MRSARSLIFVVRVLAAIVAVAATAYLSLAEFSVIQPNRKIIVAGVIALAVISLVGTVQALAWQAYRGRVSQKEAAVRQQLEAALFSVGIHTGIHPGDLSISLFLVAGLFKKRQHLARFMRIGYRPRTESLVKWTRGKGVVGRCWESDAVARMDLSRINAKWGNCTKEQWDTKAKEPTKMRLTYTEWVQTRNKYDSIVVVPLHDNGRFVGCIALNGPSHTSGWIDDREVEQALVGAAAIIEVTVRL